VYSHLPFSTFLTSCLAVLATRSQLRFSLVMSPGKSPCLRAVSQRANLRTTSLSDRETPFRVHADRTDCFTRLFSPAPFWSWETVSHLSYHAIHLRRYATCSLSARFCNLSLLANTLILHTGIIANQAKSHVPVDRVLNLHNERDMAAGPRR